MTTNKQQGGSGHAGDRERAAEAGQKGAEARQQQQKHQPRDQHGSMKDREREPQMGEKPAQGQQHQKDHGGTHQQGGAVEKGQGGREGGRR